MRTTPVQSHQGAAMNDEYITTAQAAELAGISQRGINMAIYRGYLPAGKFGPVHMIRSSHPVYVR
jgi:hypothetical protein